MSILSYLPSSYVVAAVSAASAFASIAVYRKSQPAVKPGPFTAREKELLRKTWAPVYANGKQALLTFHEKLSHLSEEISTTVFARAGAIDRQAVKFLSFMQTLVEALDDVMPLIPAVRALGVRHRAYGVKDEYYGPVAVALLETLEFWAKDAWTEEAKNAWVKAYGVLQGNMTDAANVDDQQCNAAFSK